VRTRSRLMIAALTVWLAAAPLVDHCLIGCHGDQSTTATVCHRPDRGSSGARWQPTARCNHDHTVSSAETIAKAGNGSPLKIVQTAHVSHASSPSPTLSTFVKPSATPPPGGAIAAAFSRPLRV
jgi:hypothetical protein